MSNDEKKEKSRVPHIIVKVLSIVFLLLGLAGFVLPVIPGIPFLIIGLILLGEESKLGQKILSVLPEKIRNEIKKRQLKKKGD